MALRLEVLAETQLVLQSTQEAGLFLGSSTSRVENGEDLHGDKEEWRMGVEKRLWLWLLREEISVVSWSV